MVMAEYNYQKNLKLWRLGSFGFKTPDRISYYYLKDHIGNIRVTVNEQGDIVTKDDYYPFGLRMLERSVNPDLSGPGLSYNNGNENDRLKFQSKRLQDYGNWKTYYFGWRDYDPELGRWFVVDPARQFASPYVAMGNNPIIGYDEDGRVFVTFLVAGLINVVADMVIQYTISEATNQPFNYSLIDGIKAFVQGAIFSGFSYAAEFNKLGQFGIDLMTKTGAGWSLLRGLTTVAIYTSVDIGVDVILTNKPLNDEYFINKAVGFVFQSATLSIGDHISRKYGFEPDDAFNDLTKKQQKYINKAVENGTLDMENIADIHLKMVYKKGIKRWYKWAAEEYRKSFQKRVLKKMIWSTTINVINKKFQMKKNKKRNNVFINGNYNNQFNINTDFIHNIQNNINYFYLPFNKKSDE